jgi:hypothetical protein
MKYARIDGSEFDRRRRPQSKFSPDWDEKRVRRVLDHYERQSEDEAVAEDEATLRDPRRTLTGTPPPRRMS